MSGPVGDRRWIAVLAGDMANFTRLPREIGQERAFDLLEASMRLAQDAVEAEGGRIIDTAGDGFLASFGAPIAVESASLRACRAALSFRDRIAEAEPGFRDAFGAAPQFRIGLAGGTAMIMRYDDGGTKVLGDPVNLAARLQAEAAPGEVLITAEIAGECEGAITCEDRGREALKGFEGPVRILALSGLSEGRGRFGTARRRDLTGLVSRDAELARAVDALTAMPPRVVAIGGPPGIGKSRLAHEVLGALGARDMAAQGQCAPDSGAFAPIFGLLGDAAGADPGASPPDILDHLARAYPGLVDADAADALFGEVTTEPDSRNRALRTREFLTDLLARLSGDAGRLLVIEDVHWIDPASSAVLAALAVRRPRLIVTHRPGANGPLRPADHVERITLSPLAPQHILQIAGERMGGPLSETEAALVVETSEGLPLVAEEVARALAGGTARKGDGGDDGLLTGNLEQYVLARVDRLAPETREALATAAVMGRDFSADLLSRALGRTPDLDAMMAADLVEQLQEDRWQFNHALIRDAVYAGMLSQARADAHRTVAEAIEGEDGATGTDSGALGIHFAKAGMARKAAFHLARGAAEALAVYDLERSDRLAGMAMDHVEQDATVLSEADLFDLVTTWTQTLQQLAEFQRLVDLFRRLLPRFEGEGRTPALGIMHTMVALAMTHTRDYAGAETLALATLQRAEEAGDEVVAAWAKVALIRVYEETGRKPVAELEALAREVLPVAEATGERSLAMTALYQLCSVYRSAGRRTEALETAERILRFAVEHQDRRGFAYAAWAKALVYAVDNEPQLARATVAEGRRHAIAGSGDEATCEGIELFADAFIDPSDQVIDRIRTFTEKLRRRGDYNLVHAMEFTLTLRRLRTGHLAEGWREIARLMPEVVAAGNINIERQMRLLKAEVLLSIAGLVDPEVETGGESTPAMPRKRPGAHDMLTFLRLRPVAAHLAREELEKCLKLEREDRGAGYARAKIGLGLVALRRRKRDDARAHLQTGLEAAMAEGADHLARRARGGLDRL